MSPANEFDPGIAGDGCGCSERPQVRWLVNRVKSVQGDNVGFNTGNGEKLSYSQAADQAWLRLTAFLSILMIYGVILRSHPVDHSGAPIKTFAPLRQSAASNRSWKSGKSVRAPEPPPSKRSSFASKHSLISTKKRKPTIKDRYLRQYNIQSKGNHFPSVRLLLFDVRLTDVWEDRRRRRQWVMWGGFILAILFTAILASIVVAIFTRCSCHLNQIMI